MRRFFAGLVSVVTVLVLPVSTYALSESQLDFYAQNNILFYDPSAINCDYASLGAFNGTSTEGLSNQQAAFVDTYHDIAATLSIEYGIPWEAVMAQGILESASGTTAFAIERNNFFGIGAFDSDPNKARSFDTPEEGWRGYYENIKNTSVYRSYGVFSGDAITDPYVYIQVIKNAGYATDMNYVAKATPLITAIIARSVENGWESSAELANTHPEMLENAANNASGEGSSAAAKSIAVCSSYAGAGELISGGMTLSDARQFMEPYRSISPRNYGETGAYLSKWRINNVSSCTSDLENCVAFVQYFICEYTSVCMALPDGKDVVRTLLKSGKGFSDNGTTPKVYSIFSTNSPGKNHTGVVLGIDEARGKIIIGEAGCNASFDWTTAHEYELSEYTSGRYVYASTDGLIGF